MDRSVFDSQMMRRCIELSAAAVQQRELPIARLLLDAGANPDKSDAAAGYSARDYATRDPRARDILKMIEDKKPKAAAAK